MKVTFQGKQTVFPGSPCLNHEAFLSAEKEAPVEMAAPGQHLLAHCHALVSSGGHVRREQGPGGGGLAQHALCQVPAEFSEFPEVPSLPPARWDQRRAACHIVKTANVGVWSTCNPQTHSTTRRLSH